MTDTIEPVVGIDASDKHHRQLHLDILSALSWVPSGFGVTAGAGLTAIVAAGRAFLGGIHAERDVSTNLTMVDAATNHVFVYVDDVLNDGTVYFHVDQDNTPPTQGPSHKLAEVTTAAGAITLITDRRRLHPQVDKDLGLTTGVLRSDVVGRFRLRDLANAAYKGLDLLDLAIGGVPLIDSAGLVDGIDVGAHVHSGGFLGLAVSHADLASVLADQHHAQAHIVDSTGSHAQSGLTAGHVLRATGAAIFGFGQAQHGDLGGVTTDQHHAQNHATRHQPGGADPMAVDAAVGTGSLRTLGAGSQQAAAGNVVNALRNKDLSIWANAMDVRIGSPVKQTINEIHAWRLQISGTTGVSGGFRYPRDAPTLTSVTVKLYWRLSAANAGGYRIEIIVRAIAQGEDVTTGSSVFMLQTITGPGDDDMEITTFNGTLTINPDEWVSISIVRLGDDAADTGTSGFDVLGASFEYVAG